LLKKGTVGENLEEIGTSRIKSFREKNGSIYQTTTGERNIDKKGTLVWEKSYVLRHQEPYIGVHKRGHSGALKE